MTTYKILKGGIADKEYGVIRTNADNTVTSFCFDADNIDYQQFKKDIMDGGELQDADGVVMSADAAKEFIKTLP